MRCRQEPRTSCTCAVLPEISTSGTRTASFASLPAVWQSYMKIMETMRAGTSRVAADSSCRSGDAHRGQGTVSYTYAEFWISDTRRMIASSRLDGYLYTVERRSPSAIAFYHASFHDFIAAKRRSCRHT